MVHQLRLKQGFLDDIRTGHLTFLFGPMQDDFRLGDIIDLLEVGHAKGGLSGRSIFVKITYLLRGLGSDIPSGYVCMSIVVYNPRPPGIGSPLSNIDTSGLLA